LNALGQGVGLIESFKSNYCESVFHLIYKDRTTTHLVQLPEEYV